MENNQKLVLFIAIVLCVLVIFSVSNTSILKPQETQGNNIWTGGNTYEVVANQPLQVKFTVYVYDYWINGVNQPHIDRWRIEITIRDPAGNTIVHDNDKEIYQGYDTGDPYGCQFTRTFPEYTFDKVGNWSAYVIVYIYRPYFMKVGFVNIPLKVIYSDYNSSLEFHIRNEEGEPISPYVKIYNSENELLKSGKAFSTGRYRIGKLQEGTLHVIFTQDGYYTKDTYIDFHGDTSLEIIMQKIVAEKEIPTTPEVPTTPTTPSETPGFETISLIMGLIIAIIILKKKNVGK